MEVELGSRRTVTFSDMAPELALLATTIGFSAVATAIWSVVSISPAACGEESAAMDSVGIANGLVLLSSPENGGTERAGVRIVGMSAEPKIAVSGLGTLVSGGCDVVAESELHAGIETVELELEDWGGDIDMGRVASELEIEIRSPPSSLLWSDTLFHRLDLTNRSDLRQADR